MAVAVAELSPQKSEITTSDPGKSLYSKVSKNRNGISVGLEYGSIHASFQWNVLIIKNAKVDQQKC